MTQKHYDMLKEAADLELQAAINQSYARKMEVSPRLSSRVRGSINQSYARKMEETAERTGGMLGSLANPNQYAAHIHGAETKRLRAAQLREQVRDEIQAGA